jgi:hypothetical protein
MSALAKKASKGPHLVRAAIDFSSQITLSDVRGKAVRRAATIATAKPVHTSPAQANAHESGAPMCVENSPLIEQTESTPVTTSGFKAMFSSVATRFESFAKKRTAATPAIAVDDQIVTNHAHDEDLDEIDDASAFAEANTSQISQHDLSVHDRAQSLATPARAGIVNTYEPSTTEIDHTEVYHAYDHLELGEHTVPAMATSSDLAALADSVHTHPIETEDVAVIHTHDEEPDTHVSESSPEEFAEHQTAADEDHVVVEHQATPTEDIVEHHVGPIEEDVAQHQVPLYEEDIVEHQTTPTEEYADDAEAEHEDASIEEDAHQAEEEHLIPEDEEIDEYSLFESDEQPVDQTHLATNHTNEEAVSFEQLNDTGLSAFFRPLTEAEMLAAENTLDTNDIEEVGAAITWTLPLGMPEAPRDPSSRMNLVALAIDLGMYDVVSAAASQDPHPGVRQAAADAIEVEQAA